MELSRLDGGGDELLLRRWPSTGDAGKVLYLHSLGPAASAAFLDLVATPIVRAGFELAGPDLPGFGGSPPLTAPSYELTALAELAWRTADELGWPEVVLMGHSWGGAIACHAAAARPERVRALILVDSGHLDYADTADADLDATLEELVAESESRRLHADDREHVARELEVDPADRLVDAFCEGLTDDGTGKLISTTLPATRAAALYHLMRARQSDTWPAIAAAGIPTLLLLATVPADTRLQNEAAAKSFSAALPDAEVRFVEGATHSMITDLRDDLGTTITAWLQQVPSP